MTLTKMKVSPGYPADRNYTIATEVMGFKEINGELHFPIGYNPDGSTAAWEKAKSIPDYYGDIGQALKVLDKIKNQPFLAISNKASEGEYWVYIDTICVQGSTLSEAICEAVLKHVRNQK